MVIPSPVVGCVASTASRPLMTRRRVGITTYSVPRRYAAIRLPLEIALSRMSYCLWVHSANESSLRTAPKSAAPITHDASQHASSLLDVCHRDEFLGGVSERNVTRTETNRGDTGLIQQRGIRPGGKSLDPDRHPLSVESTAQTLDYRSVNRDITRCLRGIQFNLGAESRVVSTDSLAGISYLPQSQGGVFSGQRPPLDRELAPLRVGGHPDAPVDRRRMKRGAAEQRMAPASFSRLLERIELGEEQASVHDRIDPEIVAAAVSGAPG